MVDHRPVGAEHTQRGIEGEWKGVSEEVQHGPNPGFMHFCEFTGDRNSHHPRGVRLELTTSTG